MTKELLKEISLNNGKEDISRLKRKEAKRSDRNENRRKRNEKRDKQI